MSILNASIQRIHCIGVGGIGVSGLAELLQKKGYKVSGSDSQQSLVTSRLEKLGLTINIGHASDHVKSADLVVYSSAISKENPEIIMAHSSGIPSVSRGQLLADLMPPQFGIAVAGTHGKTTTTGCIAHLFVTAKQDPTYVIGGRLRNEDSTVRFGSGEYFIAEADESDQSFLYMHPSIAVVTNIEADHLENYEGDFDHLKQSFLKFIENLPKDGLAILGIDCPVVRSLLPSISRRVITFGFAEDADFRITDLQFQGLQTKVAVERNGLSPLSFNLNMPGRHNVLNALASVVIASEQAISDKDVIDALASFPGMGRRFHPHGKIELGQGSALLFEDYGHHPSAIKATLSMAKQAWPGQRIVLVFQPHRYSRTKELMDDFVRVLPEADVLVLLDVYAASEALDKQGSAEALYQALKKHDQKLIFVPEFADVVPRLHEILHDNDIVILQGAGNVGQLAEALRNS